MTRPFCLLAWLVSLAVAPAAGGEAADLVSHRALYQVSLGGGSGGIGGATGVAVASLELACDGWIVSQRMTTDVAVGEDRTLRMETRFAGWESLDHRSYRFAVNNSFGDQGEAYKGRADAGTGAAPGSVTYSVPREGTVPIPAGVSFPVAHLRRLIDDAAGGKRLVSATVFEGSDDVGPRLATTFIRPAPPLDAAVAEALGPLAGGPAWVMRTAYFPGDSTATVPDFEVEATQLANGIASVILLDYREFSIVLTLQSVEKLPTTAC